MGKVLIKSFKAKLWSVLLCPVTDSKYPKWIRKLIFDNVSILS